MPVPTTVIMTMFMPPGLSITVIPPVFVPVTRAVVIVALVVTMVV
jgi:hypothetical protein